MPYRSRGLRLCLVAIIKEYGYTNTNTPSTELLAHIIVIVKTSHIHLLRRYFCSTPSPQQTHTNTHTLSLPTDPLHMIMPPQQLPLLAQRLRLTLFDLRKSRPTKLVSIILTALLSIKYLLLTSFPL